MASSDREYSCLQHQDLEHEVRIELRPPALATDAAAKSGNQRAREDFKIENRGQPFQQITRRAQYLVPIGKSKETGCPAINPFAALLVR